MPKNKTKEDTPNNKSLESWIWAAACAIRGAKDAGKFKDFILPLIFVKRLCDVFDDEVNRIAKGGSRVEALKKIDADHSRVRFYIPLKAKDPETQDTWSVIRSLSANIGEELTRIIREIAAHNSPLDGVIDTVDYNATTRGQREIDDDRLSNLIEAISQKRLGLHDVEPDIIGRSYEYLIRKFAEGSGQTAGEFYTPAEVGLVMAYIMDPEPGMEVYDPACGSAGLLIKCELVLNEKQDKAGKKTYAPLRLYGQESMSSTWAMAKMNMVIHDMEGDIELGDTFNNPKFKDETGHGVKKFDRAVANPMWNQPGFNEELYTNDAYHRFPAGNPGGKGDWGWAQHIYSSLKDNGRAAVVLDTGAASRGSGNANTNKEKDVRKWFIEQDLIEGVIYLPENLFYNTNSPGIIVFLNRNKSTKLKDKIMFINASKEFVKGDPKNYISDEQVLNISKIYNTRKEVKNFSSLVGRKDVVENDYNIAPDVYVHTADLNINQSISTIADDLSKLEEKSLLIGNEIKQHLKNVNKYTRIISKKCDFVSLADEEYFETVNGLWTGKKPPYVDCVVIRNTNFGKNGNIDLSNVAILQVEEKQFAKRKLKKGDIIIERSGGGPKQPVGRVVYFGISDKKNYSFSNFTSVIRIKDSERLNSKFVFYILHDFYLRGNTESLQRRTTGIRNLDFNKYLSIIKIPLISIDDQNIIVRAIDTVRDNIFVNNERSLLTQNLFKTLLHELMSGERRADSI